jgi:hypothetical protein
MKVYISGTFTAQARLRPWADRLWQLGHEVTSSWLHETKHPAHLRVEEWNGVLADKDVSEVCASDCLILDLDGESTTGGRYTEWGLVLYPGSMRLRFTVGGTEEVLKNAVFISKAHRRFATWDDLIAYFKENFSGV